MADETKKIILQLQIDQAKSLGDIVTLKDRVSKLKEEQKALNLSTIEGKKANEAYNAQIKALTKEQRSLELAVEKTAAGFEYETGSLAANRAELSKLNVEIKNLANPTKDQIAKVKDLSDKVKEQEAALGNNTRNVGNYKDALTGISGQLGVFGPQIQQLTLGFNGVSKGLQIAGNGFKTLRGAIITTGIGILLIAFTSLIQYFQRTDEGATKLEGIFGALGAVTSEVAGFVAELGGRLIDIATGAGSLEEALGDLGEFLINNVANRFKAVTVAGEAFFKLLTGDAKGALKTGTDAAIQFATGIEGGTDKISAFAKEMEAVALEAFNYAVQLDAVNDAQRELDVTNSRSKTIVQELIKTANNKTLKDQERIDKLLEANRIEEKSFSDQKKIDQERLRLVSERNLREQKALNSKLERDLKEAKSEKEKAKIRKDAFQISDKLAQEEADIQIKLADQQTAFNALTVKNANRVAQLNADIAADRQRAYEAYIKQLQEINNLEVSLSNQRQARVIADLDYELSKTDLNSQQRITLLRIRGEEEIALQKEITDEKLAQITTLSLKEGANLQALELEKIAIIEAAKQEIINIERKTADQITEIAKKETKDKEIELQKQKDARVKQAQQINGILQEGLSIAASINQTSLQIDLERNEKARKQAIQNAKGDKTQIDALNKKYDQINQARTKKATLNDLTIKEISAVANTATGFTQALAQSGPLGIITGALVLAAGAAQIAAIETQKSRLAKGGLLTGPSHNAGGISGTGRFGNIEVEGGEFVVNKRATRENLPLLHYINQPKGNRPPMRRGHMANGGILDGGFAARRSNESALSDVNIRNIVQDTVRNMPPSVVLVKDIEDGVNRVNKVKTRANVTK